MFLIAHIMDCFKCIQTQNYLEKISYQCSWRLSGWAGCGVTRRTDERAPATHTYVSSHGLPAFPMHGSQCDPLDSLALVCVGEARTHVRLHISCVPYLRQQLLAWGADQWAWARAAGVLRSWPSPLCTTLRWKCWRSDDGSACEYFFPQHIFSNEMPSLKRKTCSWKFHSCHCLQSFCILDCSEKTLSTATLVN